MDLNNSDDIMVVLNLADAARREGAMWVILHTKYLPYARQDRVCHAGESFALEVFIKMLSASGIDYVSCLDVHSDVAKSLFDKYDIKFYSIPQHELASKLPKFDVLIAPDKGAMKKLELYDVDSQKVFLSKTRTEKSIIYDEYHYDTIRGNVCVVDDICDFGGTFLACGEMLKRTQPSLTSLSLYITHGLLGKGTSELKKYYDVIYVSNLMNDSVKDTVIVL